MKKIPTDRIEFYIGYRERDGTPSKPDPKQQRAIDAIKDPKIREVLLHGGTKSGKTATAIWSSIEFALERPGVRCLLGHVDEQSLNSSLLYHLFMQVPEFYLDEAGNQQKIRFQDKKKQTVTIRIPGLIGKSGYTIEYDYRPLDPRKRLHEKLAISGSEYGIIILDQLEMLSREVRDACKPRVNQWPFKFIYTANPHPGDWWVDEFFESKDPSKACFLLNPTDNKHLDPEYLKMLDSLPEDLKRRYKYGKYEIFRGLIYKDFGPQHIFEPSYPFSPSAILFEAIDPGGTLDPFAVEWWLSYPSGRYEQIDEATYRDVTPQEAARAILTHRTSILSANRGQNVNLRFGLTISDPSVGDMTNRNSMASQLAAYVHHDGTRLICTQATSKGIKDKNITFARIRRFQEYLRQTVVENGLKIPMIRIAASCVDTQRQYAEWVWDDRKKNETPVDYRRKRADGTVDHHFDHCRCGLYFISWAYSNNAIIPVEVKPKARDYKMIEERTSTSLLDRFA